MGGQEFERTYGAPHYRVWDALMATITDLGYKDVTPNLPAGSITYRTGMSLATWRGQQMIAVVREQGESTVVSLSGHVDFPQAFSWGEKKRLANKVLDRLDKRLAG